MFRAKLQYRFPKRIYIGQINNYDTCTRKGVIFTMHLLDKLAALAIVAQLILFVVFSYLFLGKLNEIKGAIQTREIAVMQQPTVTPADTVTPTVTPINSFNRGATGAAVPSQPVRSIK